jgi:type II secretion system protein N
LTIGIKGKKAFHAVIFVLIVMLLFIIFLHIGFPYESLKMRIIEELETKTPFLYEIEEVIPYPLVGLTLKNVVIYSMVGPKKIKVMGVERFRVAISLLQLLRGKVYLRLWGEILGGIVEGGASKRGGQGEIRLSGRDINLRRIHILSDVVGVEMAGIMEGKTELTLSEGGISKQSGIAEFTISGAMLSRLPLPGLAPLRVGLIQGSTELRGGNAIIKRLAFSGGDFNGEVLGSIFLNPKISQSTLNLRVTIRPSEKFDPKHRVLISLFGRRGQTEKIYSFSLRGTLGSPRIVTK